MLGISRWRHRHLLAAWATYWLALVAVKLGGAIRSILEVTGPNGHGSASGSFDDKGVTLTVINGASTAWTGTAPFSTIALWVAGPPLLLWVVWMLSRPRQDALSASPNAAGTDGNPARPLRAGQESFGGIKREDEAHERQQRD